MILNFWRKVTGYISPKLPIELFILSIRITFAMLAATFRLIVPPSMKNLLGETVLISGAGHGIGRELALQLAALGCIVVCWDNDVEANKLTLSKILTNGGEAYAFVVDISKRLEVRETLRIMRKSGISDVSILINNAEISLHGPFLEHYSDDIEKIFNINVLSNFWTIQSCLPNMLQSGKGHIVSLCNMFGLYDASNNVPYCSSKYAVKGLMESLKEEIKMDSRKPQIHFTVIYPYYVNAGLTKESKYRFPYLFGAASSEFAAKEIIKAIRRNCSEYSIPRSFLYLDTINRVIPLSVKNLLLDFLSNVR
ncbi:short-chain dehydrogenase/reductase family 16C member 6-like isoform X2 [Leptopilina heterotoma]|uniref:short-chain dehydrogenase/reductase family 16C member 6-like isoform X2 n=1 Tax=Leptopilina heterotoma TaxID=63436 RepID=UPI001CA9ED10|nr:short-chain dehydrogenase/reductase family 16C member 6-like isoform X2 [Leptopilina heterotoma]XP_043461593.1 short-chain dehydrogenase/reductase family 16C member 6-like isoform X2 [Leptopilina heterotoma]